MEEIAALPRERICCFTGHLHLPAEELPALAGRLEDVYKRQS